MVSPSKKRKLENKTLTKSNVKTGDLKIKRSLQPLVEYTFYLNLKNHATAARTETRLRKLGAAVDDFLSKEVNYVVTDRPEWVVEGKSHSALGQWPPSVASPAVPEEAKKKTQKSRADAMLEKAKLQQTNLCLIDPLENASRWGIPIWPLERLTKWIEKIESSLQNNVPSLRIRPFKGPFIKIEDINKKYRPLYGNLANWPSINLDYGCPFSSPKLVPGKVSILSHAPNAGNCQQGDRRMTRKSKVPKPEDKAKAPEVLYPGHCEICEVNYVDLKQHLNSSTHLKFTEDCSHYEDLDNLIKQTSTVEDFLKANLPRRSPRSAVAAEPQDHCEEPEMRKLPVVAVCNGQLRRSSLRQAESKAKKESPETNGKKEDFIHNLRKRYPEGILRHRLRSRNSEGSSHDSSEEMGGTESKPKTEDLNGKVHSSEDDSTCSSSRVFKRKRLSVEEKLLEDNKEYYKLEVKSAKLRSSGFLCQVNKVEYDDECANHVPSTPLAEQLSSIKEEADSPKRRKLCPEPTKTDRLPELAHELQFSFEKEPCSEPWYNTYRRQDDHNEYLEGFEDFQFRKRLILPYEMPEFQRMIAAKNRKLFKQSTSPLRNKFTARSRAMQLVADAKNPRKSPRCHASTRANLSHSKKRRRSMGCSPEPGIVPPPLEVNINDVDKTLDEMLASPSTPELSPAGRVRRKSARKILSEEDTDGDDLVAELSNAATTEAVAFKSELDVLHLYEDYKKCDCTHHVKPEYQLAPVKQEEPSLVQPDILRLVARNKRRLESTSECSTLDTVSEAGTNASSSRGRFKKRKRNLTGWPSNKPRKRQAKPAETESKIVGVTIKLVQDKRAKGKVKLVLSSNNRARKQTASSPAKRKARSESPRKASSSSAETPTAQTSPIRKKLVVNRTCRARTRNSTSLRTRR